MIAILFLLSLYIGLLVGIALGTNKMEKLTRPLIKGYEKDVKYWFDSYLKLLKDYQKM